MASNDGDARVRPGGKGKQRSDDSLASSSSSSSSHPSRPGDGHTPSNPSSDSNPTDSPSKNNKQKHHNRNQQRLRHNAAFNKMLSGGRPQPSFTPPSSSGSGSPPRNTPPHLRRGGQGRNFSSPPRTPPRDMRSYGPHQRQQTENAVSLGRGAALQAQQQQQQQQQPFAGMNMPARAINRPRNQSKTYYNPAELRVYVYRVPNIWTTWDIYRYFEVFGNIAYIKLLEPGTLNKDAVVEFRPAPQDCSWAGATLRGPAPDGRVQDLATRNISDGPSVHDSSVPGKTLPGWMELPLSQIDFGIMKDEGTMLVMHTSSDTETSVPKLALDLKRKSLFLIFSVRMPSPSGQERVVERQFKMVINPTQVCEASIEDPEGETAALIMTLDMPPVVERQISNIQATHEPGKAVWNDRMAWFRQTDIDQDPTGRRSTVQLQKEHCIIDISRWLTYRLVFSKNRRGDDIFQALVDHNIMIENDKNLTYDQSYYANSKALWGTLDSTPPNKAIDEANSFLSDLQTMADDEANLSFDVRYRLEVCLSQGALHECNITKDFIKKLSAMAVNDQPRVCKMLERAAEAKTRYYDPNEIFRLRNQVSVAEKKRPGYCTKIPSANVTPSTIYYATPVLETSNRVIRQFSKFEDHFLRVKFTDEKYKGPIFVDENRHMDEVLSRIKRAMAYGITIGDRHYEFLAFGNSQFREHGAYFFCPTPSLSAQMIRDWMGNFSDIKVVAKYCSRLGMCFSTTRAIPNSVDLRRIPDVERNGFCFTDGVGKISPFLARMIANTFNLPNTDVEYPSAFQFRMAGCKGVVAVDPTLKGRTIEIRNSQEKFPAQFYGLEICRISQFSTAYLNMQLILVLSALGVEDAVFVRKLRVILADLSEAMADEKKAKELLQKYIDFNQMTIQLASMIFDGFMETQEPFFVSCLRLWRSWSLKYLKEKARIYVENGAFVLGTTDETQTLRGHFEQKAEATGMMGEEPEISQDHEAMKETLPEIFLQIPDPESQGKWKVVEEICVLARNPSLHPGDVRVVRAVDVPALHHLKNCVVLPQTGDRPLANMCSGGDLDGDDYLVMWDKDLFPSEWNHAPMDYTPPTPVVARGPVTVEDINNFFVKHIKYNNLSRIAAAHRYWADANTDGVKGAKCLELAQLHSMAVDFAKTGVPAEMPSELRTRRWPHWSEPKNKESRKIYRSNKVLGKLYNEVKKEPFYAAWELPFDERILKACEPDEKMLQDARDIKVQYDEALHRIMAAHGIKTEFEVWTGFVLEHHQDINDYKFAENIGEIAGTLREQFQELCYEKAGTNKTERKWDLLKPFLVAMYTVTAQEVEQAVAACQETIIRGGQEVLVREMNFDTMPFMSFPWLFVRELGMIATGSAPGSSFASGMVRAARPTVKSSQKKQAIVDLMGDLQLPSLPEIKTDMGVVRDGDVLDVGGGGGGVVGGLNTVAPWWKTMSFTAKKDNKSQKENEKPVMKTEQQPTETLPLESRVDTPAPDEATIAAPPDIAIQEKTPSAPAEGGDGGDEDEDEVEEQVTISFDNEPSALDRFTARFGGGEE